MGQNFCHGYAVLLRALVNSKSCSSTFACKGKVIRMNFYRGAFLNFFQSALRKMTDPK
jgi:hypothetical protein